MPKKLGELLLEEHLITEEQLALALEHQEKHGGVIGSILVQMGFVKERDVASALATKYGIEPVNLDTVLPPPDVLHLVPKAKARQHRLVPVATDGRTLTVASADPTNFSALDDIQFITGLKVETVYAPVGAIREAIEHFYAPLTRVGLSRSSSPGQVIFELGDADPASVTFPQAPMAETSSAEEDTAGWLARVVVADALRRGATEIHLESPWSTFRIRFRIDGVLYVVLQLARGLLPTEAAVRPEALVDRFKRLAGLEATSPERPREGSVDVEQELPGATLSVQLGVATLPTTSGERMVLTPRVERALTNGELTPSPAPLSDRFPGWDRQTKETAFLAAVERGQDPVVKALLQSGVEADPGPAARTPVMVAAGRGRRRTVRLLIEHGADPQRPDGGLTSLMVAAYQGHAETVEELASHGASEDDRQRALLLATREGHAAAVRALLRTGASFRKDALLAACRYGHVEVVRELLAVLTPVTLHVTLRAGLLAAAPGGYEELVRLLLQWSRGAMEQPVVDRALSAAVKGFYPPTRPPYRRASRLAETRKLIADYHGTVRLLLEAGANPNRA